MNSKLTNKIEALEHTVHFRDDGARHQFFLLLGSILRDVRELERKVEFWHNHGGPEFLASERRQAKREAYEHARGIARVEDGCGDAAHHIANRLQDAIDALDAEESDNE